MSDQEDDNSEQGFRNQLADWFGRHLADNLKRHNELISIGSENYISERNTHPIIHPIYENLRKRNLQTVHWAILLRQLLKCKNVLYYKVGTVYQKVYAILTGKVIGENTFNLLPQDEQNLWLEEYVEDFNITQDPKRKADHLKYCVRSAIDLSEFCREQKLNPHYNQITVNVLPSCTMSNYSVHF